jgi:hypothetical protein
MTGLVEIAMTMKAMLVPFCRVVCAGGSGTAFIFRKSSIAQAR